MAEEAKSKKELREEQKTLRAEKAEINVEIRKFKKEHGTDVPKKVKDETLKAQLGEMITNRDAKEEAITALKKSMESATSSREKYAYPQIEDAESKEMRDLTKGEKKRWRAHARGVAEKENITPEAVPFDAEFFAPKPPKKTKEEKAAEKEAKKAEKEAAKGDAKPEAEADAPVADAPVADAPATDAKPKARKRKRD